MKPFFTFCTIRTYKQFIHPDDSRSLREFTVGFILFLTSDSGSSWKIPGCPEHTVCLLFSFICHPNPVSFFLFIFIYLSLNKTPASSVLSYTSSGAIKIIVNTSFPPGSCSWTTPRVVITTLCINFLRCGRSPKHPTWRKRERFLYRFCSLFCLYSCGNIYQQAFFACGKFLMLVFD